jgi:hypothetical protein
MSLGPPTKLLNLPHHLPTLTFWGTKLWAHEPLEDKSEHFWNTTSFSALAQWDMSPLPDISQGGLPLGVPQQQSKWNMCRWESISPGSFPEPWESGLLWILGFIVPCRPSVCNMSDSYSLHLWVFCIIRLKQVIKVQPKMWYDKVVTSAW